MEKIENLLRRFKKFGSHERKIKDCFIETVDKKFSTIIKKEDLEIKDKKIRVRASGPLKTEIILNKKFLLEELKKEGLDILDIL